jgi:hypothetical protein
MVFVQKITQSYNITVKSVDLVRVANTLFALIALKVMQRTIRNITNGKSYCKNNIEIVLGPISRTYQIS